MAPFLGGKVVETFPGSGVDGAFAGEMLPAADRRIDIKRVELDAVTEAADALGSDQGAAAAEERVEHDIAAGGAIEDSVSDQTDRLHRRVQGGEIALLPDPPEIADMRVMPDICAVAAVLTELDIVAVRGFAILEDEDQLVLAAVERAHAGIVFDPDAEVFELGVDRCSGSSQVNLVPTIHAQEIQRASGAVGGQQLQNRRQESGYPGPGHPARGHRE